MAKSEFANMTPEERRENGRKGGLASVKARREKKAMKGDTKAAEFIRDLSGNKPGSSLDIKSNGQIVIIDDIE